MEKKLKNAADKIKMPDDMKQRIISAAELAEKQRVKADNDDYIEVVRSSERITTKTRLIKTVSAIAACAVLVGGIGTTGFLLHRQNKGNLTSGEVSDSACRSCPFGDFGEFGYRFDAGDGKYGKYSDETYAKLSDFLNKFNWGSETEAPKDRDINADVEEKMYDIKWTKGDTPPVECNIHIANDGYVCYMESMMDYDGAMKAIEEKWYKIDFEAFNNGVKDILAKREGGPSPFGDFTTFDYKLGGNDAKYNDMSAETRAKLSDFLNKFDWGEEMSPDVLTEEEKNMSTINLHQLESRGNGRLYDLAVFEIGYAVYNVSTITYVKGEGEVIEQEYIKLYRVDYEAFDRGIQEILAQDINKASPFGDFRTFDFMFCKGTDNYYNKSGEVYEKIADFLNNVDWGDKVTKVEQKIPQQVAEGITYEAYWEKGDRFCFFYIENDGHVHYGENITDIDTHVVTTVADCNYYIDFEAFDKGITEILAKYKSEAPTEVFERAKLYYATADGLTPISDEGVIGLDDFLLNDFKEML